MKECRYCNKFYPESEFGIALTTKKKIYRRHKCRTCYYETKQKLRDKYRQWLVDYKKKYQCSDCGITDYRVFEFHHPHNKEKEFTIANAFYNHYGIERIKREIKKCVIICANCHRIFHHQERNRMFNLKY